MKIDEQTADNIVAQLSAAVGVLAEGRRYGIRVVATAEAVDALNQSAHPAAARVVANMVSLDEIPDALKAYF